jgi:transposase InsO family protein
MADHKNLQKLHQEDQREIKCLQQGLLAGEVHQWPAPASGPSSRQLQRDPGWELESRLEELGVLSSFSKPSVSNDNPYSETLFRAGIYSSYYPRCPFPTVDEACSCVVGILA